MINISQLQLLELQNKNSKNIYPFVSTKINDIKKVMSYDTLKRERKQDGVLAYQKVLKQVKNRY